MFLVNNTPRACYRFYNRFYNSSSPQLITFAFAFSQVRSYLTVTTTSRKSTNTNFYCNRNSILLLRKMSSRASSLETGLLQKVVLITGASSGIGRSAAIEFAKNGCRLALSGRNKDALNETADECQKIGQIPASDIFQIVGDLEKVEDCQNIVNETVKKFGQLDVLVNNAGILVAGTIETLSLEDYDRQMNVNTRSIFITTKAAVPHLKETKGNIVSVSSVNGIRSFPGVLSYNMSKAALDQFTRCVALELAPAGVRVNSVNPGVTVTNVHKNAGMNDEQYQKFLEHSKTTHALGRVGNSEEVAKAIVFLGSNLLSGFMTGVTLPVDGGRGVMCPR